MMKLRIFFFWGGGGGGVITKLDFWGGGGEGLISIHFRAFILTHVRVASFYGTFTNNADPDQTPQNVASDLGLQCLLTEYSIRICIK